MTARALTLLVHKGRFLLILYAIFDGEDERDNDAPENLAHLRCPEGQKEAGWAYVSKVIESEPHG